MSFEVAMGGGHEGLLAYFSRERSFRGTVDRARSTLHGEMIGICTESESKQLKLLYVVIGACFPKPHCGRL